MPTFTPEHLTDIASRVLASAGVPADEAQVVARSLVASNLLGHDSHGVLRLPQYLGMIGDGRVRPGAPVTVVRETSCTAVVDGNYGFGQIVARRATEIAIRKAAASGTSSVAVCHSGHVGRLGEYTTMAAEQGMIGMAMVNNHGGGLCMAPWGGISRRLSPNPLSFAIPTDEGDPILLDMTSSVCAEGKLRVMRNQGHAVPEGWVIDGQGRATTDPSDFYGPPQGALLPLGGAVGYKGFGLCLVMDILAGALSGAGCSGTSDIVGLQGLFLTVTDVGCFAAPEEFKRQVSDFIRYLKDSPRLPGVAEILVPGEPEFREQRRRLREGIPVDAETWRQIVEAAQAGGLDLANEDQLP
ncbi:MAG: Ldh family oxidoreductase [Armatimonadetes bacterium]|nr:Ldh family oxidoreductase [Armatimonadota bacterium]